MRVIPEKCRAHSISYIRFYYYHMVDILAVELVVPDCIIRPEVRVSAMI
jgi:hypothetical protein